MRPPGLFLYVRPFLCFLFPPAQYYIKHYRPYWLYFVAYVIIIAGLITYFWFSTREWGLS